MTVQIAIEPRAGDRLYEIHVGDAGDKFLVSHQGYENAEEAAHIVERLWGVTGLTADPLESSNVQPRVGPDLEHVDLTITYRSGKGVHRMIR